MDDRLKKYCPCIPAKHSAMEKRVVMQKKLQTTGAIMREFAQSLAWVAAT
ncbi:hypothetical protein OH492_16890 [Vibrio chagasii]|nr:hypothetical protein [Vibrio chagasii]